jgi:D-alanine-D-alanine ligase-like ATP-grasp enzyme
MEEANKYRWMPHHEGAVPPAGQGKRISTYTVALEAWRRGLDLTFYSVFDEENLLKVRYAVENKGKVHHFSLSMGDKVTDKAFDICNNKEVTKQYLRKGNVPVPHGKMFDENSSDEEIVAYAEELGFPLVIKPTDGNAGKGVFANIQNIDAVRELVSYVRHELGYKEIIVENYVTGDEFRIYVIEDRVLGAMNRRPASIVGDGVHNVRQLIHNQNEIRKMNPHLTSRLIKIDREIEALLLREGYDFKSVPPKGERVFLREKSNLSTGGDAIDVTDRNNTLIF